MNPRKPPAKQDIAKQLEIAQMELLEQALIGFVEEIDGKMPDDDEILAHGLHAQFSDTPLAVYEHQGHRFVNFYVWRKKEALAHLFNPKNPSVIVVARVPGDAFPPALTAFIRNHKSTDQ